MFRLFFWVIFLSIVCALIKGGEPQKGLLIGGTAAFIIGICFIKSDKAKQKESEEDRLK